jgi:heat shock protein HtpX
LAAKIDLQHKIHVLTRKEELDHVRVPGKVVIVLDILFGVVAAIIVAWFSRHREFRADAGSAQLLGRKQPMINALARLGGMVPGELPKSIQAFGITSGVGKLFSTHPPIEERIAALQAAQTA